MCDIGSSGINTHSYSPPWSEAIFYQSVGLGGGIMHTPGVPYEININNNSTGRMENATVPNNCRLMNRKTGRTFLSGWLVESLLVCKEFILFFQPNVLLVEVCMNACLG